MVLSVFDQDPDGSLDCENHEDDHGDQQLPPAMKASSVVEVGHCHCRHSQEQQRDCANRLLLPPKAPAKLVRGLPAVFVPGQEIDEETFGAEPSRRRPAGADGVRPGFRGGVVIVANGARSHR